MTPTLQHFVLLAVLLFAIGLVGVLTRRNTLVLCMCLELMLSAASLALVAFAHANNSMDGAVFVFLIIAITIAELAIGLVLIAALFRKNSSAQVDEMKTLKH